MVFLFIAAGVCLIDQIIKKFVETRFGDGEERTIAGGRIRLRKVHNRGFALGLLKERSDLVRFGTAFVTAFFGVRFLITAFGKGRKAGKAGLALLIGGGLSNLIDRLTQGSVTDYLNIRTKLPVLKKLYFNLADVMIVLGSLLVFFSKKD